MTFLLPGGSPISSLTAPYRLFPIVRSSAVALPSRFFPPLPSKISSRSRHRSGIAWRKLDVVFNFTSFPVNAVHDLRSLFAVLILASAWHKKSGQIHPPRSAQRTPHFCFRIMNPSFESCPSAGETNGQKCPSFLMFLIFGEKWAKHF